MLELKIIIYNLWDSCDLAIWKGGDFMKKKRVLYAITCALGSGIIGFFVNDLDDIYGIILFTVGVALMVSSIIKLSR